MPIRIGTALLLTLQLSTALAEQAPVPTTNLRGAALSALNQCSSTRQQQACLEANTVLQNLIIQEEGAQQRLRHPRCLGALTQVETVLAAFRWRFENSRNLQQVLDAAAVQCPPNSAAVGQ